MTRVAACRAFIALVLTSLLAAAQDSKPAKGERVRLDDGRELAGPIAANDGLTIRVGDAVVDKWQVREIEGGPTPVQAEILLQRFLDEPDEGRAMRLSSRILALRDLDFSTLVDLMRRTGIRPPVDPGLSTHKLLVKETKETFEVTRYVPRGFDATSARPVWVTIHGTGGHATDPVSMMQSLADRWGFAVAGLTEIPPRQGKGWGSLPAERICEAALVHELVRQLRVDTNRVYINGWSRGGHATWDMAMHHPDLFAGAGPVIGSVLSRDRHLLPNVRPVRIDATNGAKDQPGLERAAKAVADALSAPGYDFRWYEDPNGGHDPFPERLPIVVEHLLEKVREPDPRKVEFTSYDEEARRCFWLKIEAVSADSYVRGRSIPVLGASKMTPEEAHAALESAIARNTPRISGEVDGENRVSITTHLVTRLKVGLSPKLIDFRKPVTLIVNGDKRWTKTISPSKAVLLETARRNQDRFFGWGEVLDVAVR